MSHLAEYATMAQQTRQTHAKSPRQEEERVTPRGEVVKHLVKTKLLLNQDQFAELCRENRGPEKRTVQRVWASEPISIKMFRTLAEILISALKKAGCRAPAPSELLDDFTRVYTPGLGLEKFSRRPTEGDTVVETGRKTATEVELRGLRAETAHLRDENAFLRHLLKVFHPTGAFNITEEVVSSLPLHLDTIGNVVNYIDVLLRRYVAPKISKMQMRAYFAYRLRKPLLVPTSGGEKHECLYRFGLSNSRGQLWQKGLLVWKDSNINKAYTTNDTALISDTAKAKDWGIPNQRVKWERSVSCVPVRYLKHPVGVLGFSSPRKSAEGHAAYWEFCETAAAHITAVFFCYGRQLGMGDNPDGAADRIRDELADCLDASLPPLPPS
jgi:hypothetical protein